MTTDIKAQQLDEAIRFCETALRNWPGNLRIHPDVLQDIADALFARDQAMFEYGRDSAATQGSHEVTTNA